MPTTPDQMPIASARSRASVKTFVRMRQRGRHDERRGATHHGPGRDELTDPTGERGGGRGDREDRQPEGERSSAPESIAERAGEQEQAREDDRVRVDDPLQLAHARAELTHERGQRHVHDRVVDDDDQQADAEHRQCEPPTAVRTRRSAQR